MNELFNTLLNNIPFLVAAWTAVIFLFFFIGQTMRVRKLKKRLKESEAGGFRRSIRINDLERIGREYEERRVEQVRDECRLRKQLKDLQDDNKRIEHTAEYNFQRAEEAEEARQKSAEAAAAEIMELTQKVEEAGKAAHSSGESYKEIWEDYALARAEIGRLEAADTLRDRLHQILMKVYKPYHFIHTDNEKIAKHLQSLQPKRKSRAKGVKQKV